jgi:hypothetical protein
MSMLGTLAGKWNYSVQTPGAGRLLYREGNREYTFPIFQDHGVLVLVDVPSSQRIHFFFSWHAQEQEFPASARDRILPRIAAHLRAQGGRVRVFERGTANEDFNFYPELFAHRGRASELLEAAGFDRFADYSGIELLHGEYGIEICGIHEEDQARCIGGVLRAAFPHWHHLNVCRQDAGRDPGWTVSLCMFPPQPCASGWREED